MTSGIVTVGRKQYASGLYWENSPSGRISQAAKEAARQPGTSADFYATRSASKQGRVPQFGLAPATEGFRSGVPSLAGCLANQQPGSWIGAFRLREGTSLVVVRDDLIVPDGDLFFLDETEARDRMYQELAIGGFQRIYAPESWGVPGADTMPISLLLNERTDVRLQSVALSKNAKIGITVGAAGLLLVLGIGWYIQAENAREEALRLQRLAQIERMKAEAARMALGVQKEPEYPPPERVWEKKVRPLEIISACQNALTKVPVGIAGWNISGMKCTESGLQVNWNRSGGFSAPPPQIKISDSGSNGVMSISHMGLMPRGDEQLWDPLEITKRYLNQNWTATLNRAPDDPVPAPPPGYKGPWNPPPAPWVKRSFTFTVPVLPWTLPGFIGEIPGVVVNSLTLNGSGVGSGNVWTVDGVIYENRR